VRNPAEHANGHAAGTINLPLNTLSRELDHLTPSCRLMFYVRAVIARASAQAFSKTRVSRKSTTPRAAQKPGWTPD
jgi:hypothetical protein